MVIAAAATPRRLDLALLAHQQHQSVDESHMTTLESGNRTSTRVSVKETAVELTKVVGVAMASILA